MAGVDFEGGGVKIRITVQNARSGNVWTEDYDKAGIGENGNQLQAEDWAFNLIKRFNETCRPGESHRKLLRTELLGTSTVQHNWSKMTSGMSVQFRGRIVDIVTCLNCGITGKRFGLGSVIKRDAKYRAKRFEVCSVNHQVGAL